MQHSEQCLKEQETRNQLIKEYKNKWPNYCRSCGGWGGSVFYQSHPYGSTYANEEMWDPCTDCIEDGKCPRCGWEMPEDEFEETLEFGVCRKCGWREDKPDGLPEPLDWCMCWEEEERRMQEEAEKYFNSRPLSDED